MFEAIPAAFVCILIAILVLKWNRGEISWRPSGREGGREKSAPAARNVPSPPGTFDAWAFEVLGDFDDAHKGIAARGTCTGDDLRTLMDLRGAVVEGYNAQLRFAPNDDAVLGGLRENLRRADDYMTARIRAAQSTNPALIAIRGPMSCGDGDAFDAFVA